MTIRDDALGVLTALVGQGPVGQGPGAAGNALAPAQQPHPAVSGPLEQELAVAVGDPVVDRSRIHQLLSRLSSQAAQGGVGATAARLAVRTVLEVQGPQAAGELLETWRAAGGGVGDCPWCAAELEVRVLAQLGRYTQAVDLLNDAPAGPWCPESEATLRSAALLPLLGAGHGARAAAWHRAGLHRVAHHRTRLHLVADHVDFLRLTGNGSAGVELARTHAALLRAGCTAAQRLRWFTAAAAVAAEQVDAGHGADLVTVAWPEQPTEPMTLAEFSAALRARAVPLAAAFDARCGDRRRSAALVDRHRHERVRAVLPVELTAAARAEQPPRRTGRRPVTRQDVLSCPDPYAEAEEAVLSCTLVDPVGVWEELVLRAAAESRARQAAARAVLARVLCLAGDRVRCLAEVATAAAMSEVAGDRVAVAAAKATAAASWVAVDPRRALELAELAVAQLAVLPPGVEHAAAVCRARSAGVAALLASDRLDDAECWIAQIHPAHPGQQVRVANQRAQVLRRRGRSAEAAEVLRDGVRIADEHGLVALGVEARIDLAEVLELLGDVEGAVSALTRTLLDLPHVPEPDPLEVPRIRMDLARVLAEAGRLGPARAELERAGRELPAAPHTVQDRATVDYLLGIVLRGTGHLPAALDRLDAAVAGFALADRPDVVALAERDRGAVLFTLGRSAAAEAFDAAARAGYQAGAQWLALACRIDAAQVRGCAGMASATDELHRLRAELVRAADSGAAPGQAELTFQTARVDHALAQCARAGGQIAAAAELAEQALAGYCTAGADRAVAALSVDAGSWWWQAGDTGSALRYLRGAMRSARALGDGALVARCRAALDDLDSAVHREADIAW